MKRALIGSLIAVFCLSAFVHEAEAQKKKKGQKPKAAKVEQAPPSAEIAPALGKVKWGMDKEQVQKLLSDMVRERHRPQIAKTTDGVEEDRLTTVQNGELSRIRESYVQFDERSSGWDLGFLRDEFTHNNGESMLVSKDSNSQNYYFFINDKLWKWYKALNIEVFESKGFADFADAMQRKFGKAKDVQGELVRGVGQRHWLEWQDDNTRLRAVDQTSFYGFYCLVFEDKRTLDKLPDLRRNVAEKGNKTHEMVEAVTSDKTAASSDDSPNIVDRITGKIRTQEAAQEEATQELQPTSDRGSSSSSSGSSSSGSSGFGSSRSKPSSEKSGHDDLEF